MSHFRISDDIEDHPHFYHLSDRAFRVWVYAGAWCQRHLTDGVIPRQIAVSLRRSNAATIDELVGATLLQPVGESGQELHLSGYLKHNDSRAKVDERRAKIAERQARYRQARNAVSNAVTNASPPERYVTATSPHLTSVDTKNVSTATPRAPERRFAADRRKGHHGHVFCGQRFCLSAKQLECFQRDLGRLAGVFDILGHCEGWDDEAAQSDEPIMNLLPWVRERIKRDTAGLAVPLQPRESWRDECAREHQGTCHSVDWHQTLMAAPAEYVQRKVAEALARQAVTA